MLNGSRLILVAATLAVAAPARAQPTGDGFLFKAPAASFGVQAGYSLARAGSDLFSFTTKRLTLDRSSFDAFNIGANLAFRLTPTLDLVVGTTYARSSRLSEFRDWVDNNNLPIQQTTAFTRWPITGGLNWHLMPRGRSLGKVAWVPAAYSPYVGFGVGAMWYNFEQWGDFIDFETKDVFDGSFKSSGWTPTAHALVGIDYTLGPRLSLSSEARYQFANGQPGTSFVGFQRIDLSGFTASVGLKVRY